jgi:hypothetical protein
MTYEQLDIIKIIKLKMNACWDVVPHSPVEAYQCCRGTYAPTIRRMNNMNDRGSKHLWNTSKLLPDYTAQHPRRQSFSYLLP